MEGKLFTCQRFYKADGIGNHHRQAKVSLQTTLQNFLTPSRLALQAVGLELTVKNYNSGLFESRTTSSEKSKANVHYHKRVTMWMDVKVNRYKRRTVEQIMKG